MDDAGFEQSVDGAVYGDGSKSRPFLGQLGENVVGADRRVRRGDLLENVLAQLGKAQVLFGKRLVGALNGFGQFLVAQNRCGRQIAWQWPRSSLHPRRFYFRHCIPEHVRGIARGRKRIINRTSQHPFSATIIWLLAATGQWKSGAGALAVSATTSLSRVSIFESHKQYICLLNPRTSSRPGEPLSVASVACTATGASRSCARRWSVLHCKIAVSSRGRSTS